MDDKLILLIAFPFIIFVLYKFIHGGSDQPHKSNQNDNRNVDGPDGRNVDGPDGD